MKSKNFLLSMMFSLILAATGTTSLQGQSLKGTWYAMSEFYFFKLRIILHIDSTQNGYVATSDIPEWGIFKNPVTDFNFEYTRFQI